MVIVMIVKSSLVLSLQIRIPLKISFFNYFLKIDPPHRKWGQCKKTANLRNGMAWRTVVSRMRTEPKTAAQVSWVPSRVTAKIVATSGSKALKIPVAAGEM